MNVKAMSHQMFGSTKRPVRQFERLKITNLSTMEAA
jgi:hypothetical protein